MRIWVYQETGAELVNETELTSIFLSRAGCEILPIEF